jgi:3-methyladenine DNA glycosylase AlkD
MLRRAMKTRTKAPRKKLTKDEVLAWLEKQGTQKQIDGLARYGITASKAFGVSVGTMLRLKKELDRDHALATALWKSGWYEARMFAAMIGEPEKVTRKEMNAWVAEFDNWAICDTVCWHLWDRAPHAWDRIGAWADAKPEFTKRTAFALLACLALHDKSAADEPFLAALPLIEFAASDERNFVKKGVSWALRSVGRRSAALYAASLELAERLAASKDSTERWIGKDVLRDLTRPKVKAAMARKSKAR